MDLNTKSMVTPGGRFKLEGLSNNLHNYMAVPAILLFSVFFIYPMLKGITLSLTDWNGISKANFVGLQNFFDFFKDTRARTDVGNTIIFALGSAPLLNIFGLLYALFLDSRLKGKNVARAIVYLPAVISPLIMGYIWYFILQPERGFLFNLLGSIGVNIANMDWLGNRYSALTVLVLVNVWQYVGMTMVIYLAGLQSIPQEIYEAAKMDGAEYLDTLWYITLPQLMPALKINIITNIIGSLSVFDAIMSLTEGGPGYSTESLSIYIMRMCYGSFTGYSTAVAIILFLIILVPIIISLKFFNAKEY